MNVEKVASAVRNLLGLDPKEDVFSNPDIVRLVCEKTCTVVLGVSPYEIHPDNDVESQYYEKSIAELGFIKYTTRLCKDSGIDFEPARDLCGAPDKKRVVTILSKLISFLNFRNGKLKSYQERYGKYMDQFSDATDKIDVLRSEIDADENALHLASEDAAAAEFRCSMAKDEYESVKEELNPLIEEHKRLDSQCDELEARCKELDKKIEDINVKSAQVEAECKTLEVLLSEPPDKIREEVDKIRRETAAKKSEMNALENRMADVEAQKAVLGKISEKIDKCMGDVEEITKLKKQIKDAKAVNKALQEKVDKLKAEKEATLRAIETLGKNKIPTTKARLEEIRRNRDRKREEHNAEIKKLNKEKEDSASHNSEITNETYKLRQQTQEINERLEASRRVFSEEVSRAEKILEDLSANVKTYHNALFGYIPIEYSDGNSSNDNGNSGGDDDDDDDEIDANVDANGGVNYGNSGGMMFRTGNEGNIGTTSDDDDNNGDIYI